MGEASKDFLDRMGVELLDAMFDGVYILDANRKILFWNTGAEQITGYPRELFVGRTCPDCPLQHEDAQGLKLCEGHCPAQHAIQTGQPGKSVVLATCSDGQKRPMETHIQPLRDNQGNIVGAIEVFRDISNWKRTEALAAEKDRMMGMLAHDIRNPLTVLQAYSIMMSKNPDAQIAEIGRVMEKKAKFALALVNSLLNVQAIESGSVSLQRQWLNLLQVLQEYAANFSSLAIARRVPIKVEASREDLCVYADPIRLEEIMNNLISNALKFSPEDSLVVLTASTTDQAVEIAVRDFGMGIKPADQEKIFKPFGTTTNRPANGEKSTGLGLYIIKKLMDMHQGYVRVESAPGQGTTVILQFPYDPEEFRKRLNG